ncbi:MAG: hypothetical protein HGB08_03360 [Candidatus Moranbacteria bacterium]|nr:hypothetical protein [Candidatus Moranbacteria bacterium]
MSAQQAQKEWSMRLVQTVGGMDEKCLVAQFFFDNFFLGRIPEQVRGLSEEDRRKAKEWVDLFLVNGGARTLRELFPEAWGTFQRCLNDAGLLC